ncbi:MAG: gamma-glutamylcyclotransferase family protein [Pelobacteraceae bacterium]
MERKHLVFVYGTLRKGHSNNHLLKDAYCYGTGSTEAGYTMYLISGFPYVTSSESRYPIVGELYAVDDDTLNSLDRMEGHPRYYERKQTTVIVEGERHVAWMYFRDPQGVLMKNGDYNEVNFDKAQAPEMQR